MHPRDAQIVALIKIVQALLKRVGNMVGEAGATSELVVSASPLSTAITSAPTQKKMKTTSIDWYIGATDPRIHISQYNLYMTYVGAFDATKCPLFLLTLSDQAHMCNISDAQLGRHI